MKRPILEVADIIRSAGDAFIGRNQSRLGWLQLKVLRAIKRCRTAALGGHLDQCSDAAIAPSPSSPVATGTAQSARPTPQQVARGSLEELLGVSYFHGSLRCLKNCPH
jgi:hypothetical protein